MTGDDNTVETVTKANEISEDKENIVNDKVDESLASNTGRNGGLLKNDPKKMAKIARDNGGLSNKQYLKLRKQLEEKQIEDLRNTEGAAAYRGEQIKNIKEAGPRALEMFNPKTVGGQVFWVATIGETISNFITEGMQRKLYEDSIEPEEAAKEKIGVFTQR